jgi:hypothetical protein
LSRRSAGWDTGRWSWTRNRDSSVNLRRKSWSAFARLQKESGAGPRLVRLAAAMLPNGESCRRWRRSPAARDPRRHLRVVLRMPPFRGVTHRKEPLAPRTIGNNQGHSAPLARLVRISVRPADAPMPGERLSTLGDPQREDSCPGRAMLAPRVPQNSPPAGRHGRKKTVVPAHLGHSARVRAAGTAGQGIAAGRLPRDQPQVARDRQAKPALVLAVAAEAVHLEPSRPGTRGKAATARDSINPHRVPGKAIGQDLKPQGRRRRDPVNEGHRTRPATDRDLSGPAARDLLKDSAVQARGRPHQAVPHAARAWRARLRPAPANPAQAGRGPAISRDRPPGVRTADRGRAQGPHQVLGLPGLAGSQSPITVARTGRRLGAARGRRRKAPPAAPARGGVRVRVRVRVRVQAQSGQAESGTKHPRAVPRFAAAALTMRLIRENCTAAIPC